MIVSLMDRQRLSSLKGAALLVAGARTGAAAFVMTFGAVTVVVVTMLGLGRAMPEGFVPICIIGVVAPGVVVGGGGGGGGYLIRNSSNRMAASSPIEDR